MSNELTTTSSRRDVGFSYALAPLEQRVEYVQRIAAAGIVPDAYRGNAANAFVAAETGVALGLEPLQALQSIAVIKGKATLSSDLMAAVIRGAGHKLRVIENGAESVTVTLIRRDDPDFKYTVTWDREKATRAGLWGQKGPWSQYPTQMLRARAISEVARQGASETLMGMIYTPEDFNTTVTDTGDIVEAEIVHEAPAKPAPAAKAKQAAKPAAAPSQPATLDKPLSPAQASVAKGLETLSFTQEAYDALCKRCLGQLVAVNALNNEQAATLHTELLAIYNSNHAQPTHEPEPVPEAEVEIIDDQQAPIFDYGDEPNGGGAA